MRDNASGNETTCVILANRLVVKCLCCVARLTSTAGDRDLLLDSRHQNCDWVPMDFCGGGLLL